MDEGSRRESEIPFQSWGGETQAFEVVESHADMVRLDAQSARAKARLRAYRSNKATVITADVPSEALLAPQLWERWRIEKRP